MAAEYLHFAPHATRSPPQDPHAAPQCQLEARHSPAGGHQGAKTQFEAQEAAYERAGAGGRAFGPQETSGTSRRRGESTTNCPSMAAKMSEPGQALSKHGLCDCEKTRKSIRMRNKRIKKTTPTAPQTPTQKDFRPRLLPYALIPKTQRELRGLRPAHTCAPLLNPLSCLTLSLLLLFVIISSRPLGNGAHSSQSARRKNKKSAQIS